MNRHLIAFDLDGTIMPSVRDFPEAVAQTLRLAAARGHKLMIVSARPWGMVKPYYELLGLDTPVCLLNGAYVFHPTEKSFSAVETVIPESITHNITKGVLEAVGEKLLCAYIEYNNNIYVGGEVHSPYYRYRMEVSDNVIPMTVDNVPHTKASRMLFSAESSACIEQMKEKTSGYEGVRIENIYVTSKSGDDRSRIIMINENADKWYAVLAAAKYYDIPEDRIYTFGDQWNDFYMVSKCLNGYAMKNSPAASVGRNITHLTCEEGGVADIVREKFLS